MLSINYIFNTEHENPTLKTKSKHWKPTMNTELKTNTKTTNKTTCELQLYNFDILTVNFYKMINFNGTSNYNTSIIIHFGHQNKVYNFDIRSQTWQKKNNIKLWIHKKWKIKLWYNFQTMNTKNNKLINIKQTNTNSLSMISKLRS